MMNKGQSNYASMKRIVDGLTLIVVTAPAVVKFNNMAGMRKHPATIDYLRI
jgi:hypothetical protein